MKYYNFEQNYLCSTTLVLLNIENSRRDKVSKLSGIISLSYINFAAKTHNIDGRSTSKDCNSHLIDFSTISMDESVYLSNFFDLRGATN